jgi:serine/threonine-protein kinase
VSFTPGHRFGRYLVEGELGRGGQATVYRALDTATKAQVALKVLSEELSRDASFRARFEREATAVGRLDHPAVVTIYEAGEIDGQSYLAMRLIEGTNLDAAIRSEGGLEPARVVVMLREVGGALDHAHALGMIHRDVKPANVLIDREDRAYLSDFGLAKLTEMARLTRTGMWVGTAEYIAPEQIMARDVGPPADVYALAAVAYEALTGRPPFVRANAAELLQAHLRDEPRAPSAIRRSLRPVDNVLRRGLAKEPSARFASAGAFVHALGGSLGHG